jgi:hypothetical protein
MRELPKECDRLAALTWERIASGDARGLRLREDSLTDVNLLELAVKFPNLRVHRFTQSAEKHTGADWEWWIGSSETGWNVLRVQAKRMDGNTYRMLDHPGERDDEYQYDTLIRSARAEPTATYPYFVFFNGWVSGWPSNVPMRTCPWCPPSSKCRHARAENFGAAAVPAEVVRDIHHGGLPDRRRVDRHLPHTVPWSWLFRMTAGRSSKVPDTERWLRLWYALLSNSWARGDDFGTAVQSFKELRPIPVSWAVDLIDDHRPLARSLPPYAAAIHEGTATAREFDAYWASDRSRGANEGWVGSVPAARLVVVIDVATGA